MRSGSMGSTTCDMKRYQSRTSKLAKSRSNLLGLESVEAVGWKAAEGYEEVR